MTEFAFGRLVNPAYETPALSLTRDGHLVVAVRGGIIARADAVVVWGEHLAVRPLNQRMLGRVLPDVFGRLVALVGEGQLVLSRESEQFWTVALQRDLCFFVERYLWAMECSLMYDVGFVPRSARRIQLVRVAGEGAVAIRAPGELIAVKVAPEHAYRVHRAGFVGWVGNVVPQLEDDGEFLGVQGEGAVFVALPPAPSNSVGKAEVAV